MQTRETLLSEIQRLADKHKYSGYKDAGFGLVDSIEDLNKQLSDKERAILADLLLELVRDEQPAWGAYLEVLKRQDLPSTAPRLFDLWAQQPGRSTHWRDSVMLTLLLLRYRPAADMAVKYVEQGLREKRSYISHLVAALCRVDEDNYIRLITPYLIDMANNEPEHIKNYAETVIINLAKADAGILGHLLTSVSHIDAEVGRKLKVLFEKYLDAPFTERMLGIERNTRLKQELKEMG